jgi:hypothetical protein
MRNLLIRFPAIALLIFITLPGQSMIIPVSHPVPVPLELIYHKIVSMNVKEVQQQLGRKLTLKEKLGFWFLKEKAKHELKKRAKHPEAKSTAGLTALVIAILSLLFFVVGLFVAPLLIASLVASIVAIVLGSTAKKKDPNDMKAHAAKLMGWIVLGLLALLLLIAVIAVSSWWG